MRSALSAQTTRRNPCGSRWMASPVLISRSWSTRCTLWRGAYASRARMNSGHPQSGGRRSMSLSEGDRLPDFVLPTDEGGTLSTVNLQGKTTVLYFYPRDDTPGCTTEAQAFRDALDD